MSSFKRVCDFIDEFDYDPVCPDDVADQIEERRLMVVDQADGTLLEALWSAVMPLRGTRTRWGLVQATLDEFEEKIRNRLAQDPYDTYHLLNAVASELLVEINVMSLFSPLISEVKVIPRGHDRHGLDTKLTVLHTGKSRFMGLNRANNEYNPEFFFPENVEMEPEVVTTMSDDMKSLVNRVSQLQPREDQRRESDDHPTKEPYYKMLNRNKLAEKLEKKPQKYRRCILRLQGPHEGSAEVIGENPKESIVLRGRTKCGMAFEGDEVVVKVYRGDPGGVVSGQVVGVWSSVVRPVNQIFFCRVSPDQTTLMRPICGTVPKIHVVNDIGEQTYANVFMPDAMRLFQFGLQHGGHHVEQQRRASRQHADKYMVSVYDFNVQPNSEVTFSARKALTIQRLTCEKIFVVVYQHWNPLYLYPCGYVIDVLEPQRSVGDELALLRLQCGLPHPYETSKANALIRNLNLRQGRQLTRAERKGRRDFREVLTFTIDNEVTEDMDDAISFQTVQKDVVEVGVHITDVSHYVKHGSRVDLEARSRGLSVYAGTAPAVHMLPPYLATDILSLKANEERICLCVILRFEKRRLLPPRPEDFAATIIRVDRNLSKREAAAAIRDPDASDLPAHLVDCLQELFHCATRLRTDRLRIAAMADDQPSSNLAEVGIKFEAQILIEELMVEANRRVAGFLVSRCPEHVILLKNPAPEGAFVDDWLEKHAASAHHSGILQRDLRSLDKELPILDPQQSLILSWEVKLAVEAAKSTRNFLRAYRLLSAEPLHPKLLLALQDFYSLRSVSFYEKCTNNRAADGEEAQTVTHFGLDVQLYTHFTSPLRRYCDLIIHRLLSAVLRGREPDVQLHDLYDIISKCNSRLSQIRRYKKNLKMFKLYRKTQRRPLSLPCVISDISSSQVTLQHHTIGKLIPSSRRISLAQLNPSKYLLTDDGLLTCEWKERLFIVDREARDRHANRRHPVCRFDKFDVQVFEKQAYISRRGLPDTLAVCSILICPQERERRLWMQSMVMKSVRPEPEKVPDVTSEMIEVADPEAPTAGRRFVLDTAVKFSVTFRKSEALRAQFSPTMSACHMRTASLGYLQICPSFGICFEHISEPLRCFGDTVNNVVNDGQVQFPTVASYCAAMTPVLRMESIAESIFDGNTFLLNEVPVKWFRARDTGQVRSGVLCIPEDFCKNSYRQIGLKKDGKLADCLRNDCSYLDYLCLRIQLHDCVWIGHGGVKHILTVNKTTVVYFQIHPNSHPPPNEALSKRISAFFIIKTLPKRLQERAMQHLPKLGDRPTTRLALGSRPGRMNHQFLQELRAVRFKSDLLFTVDCNAAQRKAIMNAFNWDYSLIWGPPGTGKTVTGVQITFWFVQWNHRLQPPDSSDEDDSSDSLSGDSKETDDFVSIRKKKKKMASKTISLTSSFFSSIISNTLYLDFPELPKEVNDPTPIGLQSRRRQVLYCGPSNACINCVAGHLREKVSSSGCSVVRVFSKQVEEKEFPIPGVRNMTSRLESDVEMPQQLRDVSLHHLIRLPGKCYAPLLLQFDAGFKAAQQFLDGRSTARRADITMGGRRLPGNPGVLETLRLVAEKYRRLVQCAKALELRSHDVVLCTTAVAVNQTVQRNCRFCQVIIDEAGMCTEAETLLPLVSTNHDAASAAIERVILIGDHKQLRPIVMDIAAGQLGLDRSMLERHWGRAEGNCVMLKEQYRMHPSICEFISRKIYAGRLKTALSSTWTGLDEEHIRPEMLDQWNGFNVAVVGAENYELHMRNSNANVLENTWPGIRRNGYTTFPSPVDDVLGVEERVVFLHVEGQEENLFVSSKEGHENSKANRIEAAEVVRIYMEMRTRFARPRSSLDSIAVLSQYQHQVHLIRDMLTQRLSEEASRGRIGSLFRDRNDIFRASPMPVVTSVVRSQGSEFDYVILSTVRTLPSYDINHRPTPGWERKYLGFITDINQINVALTRARKGLIIIGNGNLLRVHDFWNSLILNLQDRGCYVDNSSHFSCFDNHDLYYDEA